MYDQNCGYRKSREASRAERQAKRAAWRARWAARRASRGEWGHFGDPKFWGLDPDSMKSWGMGFGEQSHGHGQGQTHGFGSNTGETNEVAELKAQVASMEKTIDAMNQRIIVLEKLVVDDEARISREIDRLRDKPAGDK
jgi:hypothetical protein